MWHHSNFLNLWHPVLFVVTVIVTWGFFRFAGKSLPGAGEHRPSGLTAGQSTYFILAALTFYTAMGSPLALAADTYLFSAHMLQFGLMSMVIPPLLLLSIPPAVLDRLWNWPTSARVLRIATNPLVAIIVFNAVFAAIEIPGLLDASLQSGWLYTVEAYAVMILAIAMWWPIMAPIAHKSDDPAAHSETMPRRMVSRVYQLVYIFFNFAMMTLSWFYISDTSVPFYHVYDQAPRIVNLSALGDQQLGVVMIEFIMGVAFLAAFIASYSRYDDDSHWYD